MEDIQYQKKSHGGWRWKGNVRELFPETCRKTLGSNYWQTPTSGVAAKNVCCPNVWGRKWDHCQLVVNKARSTTFCWKATGTYYDHPSLRKSGSLKTREREGRSEGMGRCHPLWALGKVPVRESLGHLTGTQRQTLRFYTTKPPRN